MKKIIRSLYKRLWKGEWEFFHNSLKELEKIKEKPLYVYKFIDFLNNEIEDFFIELLDIGARNGLNASGIYSPLQTFANKLVYGIEPDIREAQKLIESQEYKKIFTEAVFERTGNYELYLTLTPGCSSILEPDYNLLNDYNLMISDWFKVDRVVNVSAKPLSNIIPQKSFSFVKIDTQGTELNILKSADTSLFERTTGFYIEAQSLSFYKDQYLLDDLLHFMKKNDYLTLSLQPLSMDGMDLEYNVTFVKDPRKIINKQQLLEHILLGFLVEKYDYVSYLTRNYGEKFLTSKTIDFIYSNFPVAHFKQGFRVEVNPNI